MKKIITLLTLVLLGIQAFSETKEIFKIEGPEREYNQIRIFNETEESDFKCKILTLKKQKDGSLSTSGTYGIFELKGFGDSDTNTSKIKRGSFIKIEVSEEYQGILNYYVTYRDMPFFDVIEIHLTDDSKFNRKI